jgi:hypothetical protein
MIFGTWIFEDFPDVHHGGLVLSCFFAVKNLGKNTSKYQEERYIVNMSPFSQLGIVFVPFANVLST